MKMAISIRIPARALIPFHDDMIKTKRYHALILQEVDDGRSMPPTRPCFPSPFPSFVMPDRAFTKNRDEEGRTR